MRSAAEAFPNHEQYKDRYVLRLGTTEEINTLPEPDRAFWSQIHDWLRCREFLAMVVDRFRRQRAQRFRNQGQLDMTADFGGNALLARDFTNYALSPHTDHSRKVVTLLFYLPATDQQEHLGTAVYTPKDKTRVSAGDEPHGKFEDFDLLKVAPYRSNSMFGFFKTNRAFHGVERIDDPNVRRDLLIYNFSARSIVGDIDL